MNRAHAFINLDLLNQEFNVIGFVVFLPFFDLALTDHIKIVLFRSLTLFFLANLALGYWIRLIIHVVFEVFEFAQVYRTNPYHSLVGHYFWRQFILSIFPDISEVWDACSMLESWKVLCTSSRDGQPRGQWLMVVCVSVPVKLLNWLDLVKNLLETTCSSFAWTYNLSIDHL